MALAIGYDYHIAGSVKGEHPLIREIKYTFKNDSKLQYIVNVQEYLHDVYVVKFHLKNHTLSSHKYNILLCKSGLSKNVKKLNINGASVYNYNEARKVLHTCVNIGAEIYSRNSYASFGFIGMPTITGDFKEDINQTARYKVYQRLAHFYFPQDKFEHRRTGERSMYLLLNRNKIAKNKIFMTILVRCFSIHIILTLFMVLKIK